MKLCGLGIRVFAVLFAFSCIHLFGQEKVYADMLQIGSRSMTNFPLLAEVGRTSVPVILKRGWCSTIEEWLCAAEYIAEEGNRDIVLCERGIRTSCQWSYARNVFDLNVIEPVRRATPLPVLGDPSHASVSIADRDGTFIFPA